MTLNYIERRGTCSEDAESVEYTDIAITPMSTLTRDGNTYLGLRY